MTADGTREAQCQAGGKEVSATSHPSTNAAEISRPSDEHQGEQSPSSGFRLLSRPEPVRTHASCTSSNGSTTVNASSRETRDVKVEGKQTEAENGSSDCCKSRCDTADPSVNLQEFIVTTLKRGKDRNLLFQLEEHLLTFLENSEQMALQFPPMSSYHRMLVHRVAAYFGLEHNVDSSSCVVVTKTSHMCAPPKRFREHLDQASENDAPKVILKRAQLSPSVPEQASSGDVQMRTKTMAEREAEYEKARARIFSQPDPVADVKSKSSKESDESSGSRQSNRRRKSDSHRQQSATNTRRCPPRLQGKSRTALSTSFPIVPQTLSSFVVASHPVVPVGRPWSSIHGTWPLAAGGGAWSTNVAGGLAGSKQIKAASHGLDGQLSARMASLGLNSEISRVQTNICVDQLPSQAQPLPAIAGVGNVPGGAVTGPAGTYLGGVAWQQAAFEHNTAPAVLPSTTVAWSTSDTSDCHPALSQTAHTGGLPLTWSSTNSRCMPGMPAHCPAIVMEVFDLVQGGDAASHLQELRQVGAILQVVQGRILASFHNLASAQCAMKFNSPNYKLRVLQPSGQPLLVQ